MEQTGEQNTDFFRPGYPREVRRLRRQPSPDPQLDKELAALFATWKGKGGNGAYPSRGIKNVACRISFPGRVLDRMIKDAVVSDVPLDRVYALAHVIARRVIHHANKHGKLQKKYEAPQLRRMAG